MYRETDPPPALRETVRCVWWNHTGGGERIVPDGCVDLVVAGESAFVAGPDTGAWQAGLPPGTPVHGVRFRPGHAPRALGVAADELTDRRVALGDLWGRAGRAVTDLLSHHPHSLTALVTERVVGTERDPMLDVVLSRLDAGVPRVRDAVAGLPLGQRQFRRRFTEAVGFGPATYLRVARLRRAMAAASAAADLASLAVEAGYSDQAHLSRECRTLTASTASAFFTTIGSGHTRPARAH
ncbi:AraC-like DNA-binding protein [Saccharomonospora amisosensis]|uniref:AraC-like DNA-binding protein n=1 Tax=Saccharomonospora amisosensis TaxID=1128677 RepID=A0A7X5UPH9_9PSEU|nr:DUF6597 domain-containing transcriptional factor [Saccharomonospora amisosensis]NIJ11512.1 AraC-like DNA-binding protein [Saccharomonospora amisosensis]